MVTPSAVEPSEDCAREWAFRIWVGVLLVSLISALGWTFYGAPHFGSGRVGGLLFAEDAGRTYVVLDVEIHGTDGMDARRMEVRDVEDGRRVWYRVGEPEDRLLGIAGGRAWMHGSSGGERELYAVDLAAGEVVLREADIGSRQPELASGVYQAEWECPEHLRVRGLDDRTWLMDVNTLEVKPDTGYIGAPRLHLWARDWHPDDMPASERVGLSAIGDRLTGRRLSMDGDWLLRSSQAPDSKDRSLQRVTGTGAVRWSIDLGDGRVLGAALHPSGLAVVLHREGAWWWHASSSLLLIDPETGGLQEVPTSSRLTPWR